ncbi:MAG: hypothetical protein JWN99_1898 [Ilumatobacteraceae bacterium]|nr:hypothetical protein [Ilumatobacteraceae bacterium]
MRRTWPIPVGIAVVGALAGIAIAGQQSGIDTFVIDAAVETSVPGSTPDPVVVTLAPTTSVAAVTVPPTTLQAAGTTSTVAVVTTTTVPASSTTSIAAATTTVAVADQTLDRPDVRLVIANGDGRFNLAGRNGDRLRAVGYTQIDLEDAGKVTATVLYYRPGFDDEAAIVAADLTVPGAQLQPLPDTPITSNDALGDIIVVLGPDAPR